MKKIEIEGKLNTAICETIYFLQLANGYIDANEETRELNPLVLVFQEIEKRIDDINNILQNQFET